MQNAKKSALHLLQFKEGLCNAYRKAQLPLGCGIEGDLPYVYM